MIQLHKNKKEIWKDVIGYEGYYKVSNFGRVKSLIRKSNNQYNKKEIIVSTRLLYGYVYIQLNKNGKANNKRVHRLVAESFLKNPFNKSQVNHINGIKNDNMVENLEWNTAQENTLHAIKTGLRVSSGMKGRTGYLNIFSKPVFQYNLNGDFIKEWISATEVMRILKIQSTSISRCCNHIIKTSGGFKWEFKKIC